METSLPSGKNKESKMLSKVSIENPKRNNKEKWTFSDVIFVHF